MTFVDVINALLGSNDVIKATGYINPKLIIRAVRKTWGRKLPRKGQNVEITLTIGRPNYAEREFIKTLKEAKEPFPVKKVQLKFYNPKPRKIGR